MSRKTVQFRRRIAQLVRVGRKDDLDVLIPRRATGTGETRRSQDETPFLRNPGAVCTLPASPDTAARMRALAKG